MGNNQTINLSGDPKKGQTINTLVHPQYNDLNTDWRLYRSVWDGGTDFVETYLKRVSSREEDSDFATRKELAYIPGHARTAILELKNSIYERFIDISRTGGSQAYHDWSNGSNGGVDGRGMNMDKFIGTVCLPELLVTKRVGVYVDAPAIEDGTTLRDTRDFSPYCYMYKAEDIRTWSCQASGKLSAVLLKDVVFTYDKTFGLTTGTEERFRLLTLEEGVVTIRFFDAKGVLLEDETLTLNLPEIPFDFVEIDHSILKDVAKHQVALLNLASTDLTFCLKANFSIYTEQYDAKSDLASFVGGDFDEGVGTQDQSSASGTNSIEVGSSGGRRYVKGLERPGFISPSADPLRASMSKQEEIRTEIRQLVNLSVSTLSPEAQSGERDDQGLESGLSFIGLTLEALERRIASFYQNYMNDSNKVATIKYPKDYRVRSEKDRREEADQLLKILPTIPSLKYQKELAKRITNLTIAHWVSFEKLTEIHKDIDDSEVVHIDPEVLLSDLEKGLVSEETASNARMYPKGEIKQARIDHAARLARILESQTSHAQARGVADLGADNDAGIKEKANSQNPDTNENAKKQVRGDQKKGLKDE